MGLVENNCNLVIVFRILHQIISKLNSYEISAVQSQKAFFLSTSIIIELIS